MYMNGKHIKQGSTQYKTSSVEGKPPHPGLGCKAPKGAEGIGADTRSLPCLLCDSVDPGFALRVSPVFDLGQHHNCTPIYIQ